MIRAVLFDVDDTLCDDSGQLRRCIVRTADEAARLQPGLDSGELTTAYENAFQQFWYGEFAQGPVSSLTEIRTLLWSRALRAASGRVDPVVLDAALEMYDLLRREPRTPFPGALDTLGGLKERGFTLGALTNGLSETHFPKIEDLGATRFFEGIFTPDLLGVAKPDPRAFRKTCERLGVDPTETAHVGDSLLTDVGGALGAGLTAIWFNPERRALPAGAARPNHTIATLPALLELFH